MTIPQADLSLKSPNKPLFLKLLNTWRTQQKEIKMLQNINEFLELTIHVIEIIMIGWKIYKDHNKDNSP